MTTDYKVTELFYIIDEFCKHFDAENAGNLLEDNSGVKRRRRAASLSDSEIMTILGLSGHSRMSTDPHLHLTTKKDGKVFDPVILLKSVHNIKSHVL